MEERREKREEKKREEGRGFRREKRIFFNKKKKRKKDSKKEEGIANWKFQRVKKQKHRRDQLILRQDVLPISDILQQQKKQSWPNFRTG